MNTKTLLFTLIGICCAPESSTTSLPSTYPATALLMLQVKACMKKPTDIKSLEKATHNAHKPAVLKQSLIFDFIDYTLKAIARTQLHGTQLKEQIQEKAMEINKAIRGDPEYSQLVDAIKRKLPEIRQIWDRGSDNLGVIWDLMPIIHLAMFDAIHITRDNLLSNSEYLSYSIYSTLKIIRQSEQPELKLKASDALAKIFEHLLTIKEQEYDLDYLAEMAHEIGNTALANKVLERGITIHGEASHYYRIAKVAHKIGNIELTTRAINRGLQTFGELDDYTDMAQLAREIGDEELVQKAYFRARNAAMED